MVISDDRDTHIYCQAFGSGAVNTCYTTGSVANLIRTPNLPLQAMHTVMLTKEWSTKL